MEILGITFAWTLDELREGARKITESNGIAEGLIRITITAGERAAARGSATITSRVLPEVPPKPALHVSTVIHRTSGPLSQCKSISRSGESAALREAQAEDAFDAILLNEKGRVAETTSRNLFALTGGVLRTPPPYEGALSGITRAAVLEIAPRLGTRTQEAPLTVAAIRGATEIFLTGSGVGVLGVASVDGRRLPTPRPVSEAIGRAYASVLDSDSRW